MPHKFPFAKKDKLISDKRKKELPAKETLLALGLREGDRLVDVGCGAGYFSFPAAEIVGPRGSVLGVDVQAEFIDYTREQIPAETSNIRFQVSGESELPCESGAADAILLSVVLHEAISQDEFLAEMKRALIPRGRLMVIEWLPIETDSGPPPHERIAPEALGDILKKHGFDVGETIPLGETHYGLVATRNA